MKRTKRRSWFGLPLKAPRSDAVPSDPDIGSRLPSSSPRVTGPDSLVPTQFLPNRIATLYVSKSERDLYMAAMSQLDRPPPPLPLWSEAPPVLPNVEASRPWCADAPTVFPPHRSTMQAMSPKLVSSPGVPVGSGSQIRDEFRSAPSPRTIRHAVLALTTPNVLRFVGFSTVTLVAVEAAIRDAWRLGISSASEDVEALRHRTLQNEGGTWKVTLNGTVWKKKGTEELDTIRLMLAVLTGLGVHGYTMTHNVQAAGSKKDAHNLIFAASQGASSNPPLFFAISIPLPDRISIISPPAKGTPALISAIRSAITTNIHPASGPDHSRSGTANTGMTLSSSGSSGPVTWGKGLKGIKVEGWVQDGVYRFWLDGMRRWLGGGVKRRVVDNLAPQLLISIVNSLSSVHYTLAGSLPLLPIVKGRDVLIFSSLPDSGLTYRDSFKPRRADPFEQVLERDSPVMVERTASLPPAREALPLRPRGEPLYVEPESRGSLWTSILAEGPPESSSQSQQPRRSDQSQLPPSALPEAYRCTSSAESNHPLIPASAQSSPRPRNVLLKKNSLNRRRSASNNSRQPSDGQYVPAVQHATRAEEEQWSMIEAPPNVDRLGLIERELPPHNESARVPASQNDVKHAANPHNDFKHVPPSQQDNLHDPAPQSDFRHIAPPPDDCGHRSSQTEMAHSTLRNDFMHAAARAESTHTSPHIGHREDRNSIIGTAESGETGPSVYHEAESDDHQDIDPLNPFHLGQPIHPGAEMTVPLREVSSPMRAARVNVESGVGIRSMVGSIGYLQSVRSGQTGHLTGDGSEFGATSELGLSTGNPGREREVGDEPQVPGGYDFGYETGSEKPGGSGRAGSARTRVSVSR